MASPTPAAALTEDSIRPDALMEMNDRLHAQDLARLLEKAAQFVRVACPACGADAPRPLWEKDGFSYETCTRCETAYVNPRPPPALLDEYYRTAENYVFWAQKVFPASEATRKERIHRPRAERVKAICARQGVAPGGTVVEVGAGHGTFCEVARESGYFSRVVAVEPVPSNAASCRARGVEVIDKPIEHVTLEPGSVDVVVSFEVIEHLYAPRDFVVACARYLRPGGLLVLSCPNIKGFEVATLGKVSRTVDLEHLNYFHPDSLAQMVRGCGLEVMELMTPGELDAEIVRKRAQAGLLDLTEQPFVKTLLLEQWDRVGASFQRFLADNLLSAHMWAVARKP